MLVFDTKSGTFVEVLHDFGAALPEEYTFPPIDRPDTSMPVGERIFNLYKDVQSLGVVVDAVSDVNISKKYQSSRDDFSKFTSICVVK